MIYIFLSIFLSLNGLHTEQFTSIENTKEIENIKEPIDIKILSLQSMETSYENMSEEHKADYGRFLGQELIKDEVFHTYRHIFQKNPIEYFDFSIDYYGRHKNNTLLAECYLYKGVYFKHSRIYKEAIENLLDALDIAEKDKDSKILGVVYKDLAFLAGYQNEMDKNLEYLEKAIQYYEQRKDNEGAAGTYSMLAWTYTALEKDSESLNTSFKVLQLTTDPLKTGDALLDIGTSYFYLNKLDSSAFYIKRSLEYPSKYTVEACKYVRLSRIMLLQEKPDSAYFYAKYALTLPMDIYYQGECYNILTEVLPFLDKQEELSYYIQKMKIVRDSIRTLESQTSMSVLEQIRDLDKQTIQIHDQRNYLIYLVLLLLSISGLIIYILYKKQQYKKREAELYKTELEGKEQILVLQKKEFRKRREILLQELEEELRQTRKKYSEQRLSGSFEQRMKIDRIIYEEVLHLANEEAFIIKMNYLLNNLPDKLKKKYPAISPKEILWCCLFMLELPTPEIAFILDYKQTSLYKFKQRLTKKLGFSNVKDLEQMLFNELHI